MAVAGEQGARRPATGREAVGCPAGDRHVGEESEDAHHGQVVHVHALYLGALHHVARVERIVLAIHRVLGAELVAVASVNECRKKALGSYVKVPSEKMPLRSPYSVSAILDGSTACCTPNLSYLNLRKEGERGYVNYECPCSAPGSS